MNTVDELKNTLCHDITLHERLRNIIIEECVCIKEDNVEYLSKKAAHKKKIEDEIESANQTVISLFEKYYSDPSTINSIKSGEIRMLVGKLNKSIHESVTVISETVEEIKRAKKDTVHQMKIFDTNKNAINAYAGTQSY